MQISTSLKHTLLGLILASSGIAITTPAQANSIEMPVYKAIDAQEVKCPDKITLTEQSRPYREGGYTIDGSAKLDWLAEKFSIADTDAFSVTWVAKLKPNYIKCKATAGTVKKSLNAYALSHLRLRFVDGKVYLILDMTGLRDINALTPAIVNQGVQNGNPTWSWAGTD